MASARAALAGILLASFPYAFALDPALDVSQYAHFSWKYRDGFARGAVNDIAQTPDGYLWLGTDFGLLRFDGIKPVPWQPPTGRHLPSDGITRLLAARDGTLWIGTLTGLASWKNGKLSTYTELAGLATSALLEDDEGSIWAGALGVPEGTLCQIRNGSVRCYAEIGGLGKGVLGLHEDDKGNLWVGLRTGVWRWKPEPAEFYKIPGQPDGIQDMADGEDGSLLIAMQGGVRRLVGGKVQMAYPFPAALQRVEALRMLRDRDGGLWIGTSGRGIVHLHRERTDVYSQSDGLTGDTVDRLFEDREGNIWVATVNGLSRFRDLSITTYSTSQGLSNAPSGAVLAARDGSIWFGTRDGGLNRLNNGQVTVYRQRGARAKLGAREIAISGLPDRGLASLFEDSRGRIWVSALTGVGYLENDRFTSVPVPGGHVDALAEDPAGNLWITSQELGLFKLSPAKEVQQISWETLGHKDPGLSLALDPSQGGLWLGFYNGGLVYFRDGQVRATYSAAEGLGAGHVNHLRFDREGALWAATEGGLSRLKNGSIATLTSKNGLPCDAVQWTIDDDAQSAWLNMPCGLVRVARSELDTWAAGADPGRTIHASVFDNSDGVRSRPALGGYTPRVAKSPDGKLWFYNVDGIDVVDPSHLPFNKLPPPVHIEAVKINGKQQPPDEGLKLSHKSNDLEIDYTALSFTNPDRVFFRYKLEGKDGDWQDVGTRRQAYYTDLAPKQYRFRVIASNNDGVWNEAGALWNFSITPAYYQRIWFQALCVVAGVALLWLSYRLRLRQVARRFNLLYTERLAERTRIARDLHDTLLQSLAGVSLQLNGVAMHVAPVSEKAASMIGRIREQVDNAFREAREKVWNLRSPELEVFGLDASLRQIAERIGAGTTAGCNVTVSGQPRTVEPDVEEELLRIAQEAANNASRHAEPNEIRIALDYGANSLMLSISDDGRGFDLEEGMRKTGHWGLKNMPERAAKIGGTCKITSAPGQGTRIEVRVPLTRAKHAHTSSGT